MLIRLRRDERGVAMIVALLVSFVVLLLSIFVVNLSLHNAGTSAYDRKRVLSIAAAESGINMFWNILGKTAPEDLPCADPLIGTLSTSPGGAGYSATATYFDAAGTQISCATLSQDNSPVAALVTSIGTTNGTVPRTMQAYMDLRATYGAGWDAVVIADFDMATSNQITIKPCDATDPACPEGGQISNIYVNNGDLRLENSLTIDGNVFVSGGASGPTLDGNICLANGASVSGNVWAWNRITLASPQSTIGGYARSSDSSISKSDASYWPSGSACRTSSSGGVIKGDAWAASAINVAVSGTKHPNSPTDVHPDQQPLPYLCWTDISGFVDQAGKPLCKSTEADWLNPPLTDPPTDPYTIQTFTGPSACTQAASFLTSGTIAGNTVVRIAETCDLQITNRSNINFNGNLAIYTDGSITTQQQNNWNGIGSRRNLYLIVGYQASMVNSSPATYCASGVHDITTSSLTTFSNALTSVYTPCGIHINNNTSNGFSGQILGGTIYPSNNFTLTYYPILVPGAAKKIGFQQDVAYLREVA